MSKELADLLASKFIARTDVKATQNPDGSWKPHTTDGKIDSPKIKWRRADLEAHLAGEATYGHYLLSQADECKLFAFDIDLEKNQLDPDKPNFFQGVWPEFHDNEAVTLHNFDAREDWKSRKHPARPWSKYQLKMVASQLASAIHEMGIPVAVAYSGSKGLHVYGFTGPLSAELAIEGAMIALDSLEAWQPSRGTNFFRSIDQDPITGYPNLSIEVFPKQASLEGKSLGNLMRLPLGVNRKNPRDPTFFVDLRSPMGQIVPVDPMWALTTTNPWTD